MAPLYAEGDDNILRIGASQPTNDEGRGDCGLVKGQMLQGVPNCSSPDPMKKNQKPIYLLYIIYVGARCVLVVAFPNSWFLACNKPDATCSIS
jgi:hypothetical protein